MIRSLFPKLSRLPADRISSFEDPHKCWACDIVTQKSKDGDDREFIAYVYGKTRKQAEDRADAIVLLGEELYAD